MSNSDENAETSPDSRAVKEIRSESWSASAAIQNEPDKTYHEYMIPRSAQVATAETVDSSEKPSKDRLENHSQTQDIDQSPDVVPCFSVINKNISRVKSFKRKSNCKRAVRKCAAEPCSNCHRCRCSNCAENRRSLPSKWICKDTCLLSSDSVVDTLSCFCCIKALRYHYESCQEPAAVDDHRLYPTFRYRPPNVASILCVFIASICFPCLWCYFPLKLCQRGLEAVYSKCTDNACHCESR
uniref:Sprouty n=1 Tax=Syphacia muris TaxID=451379 RepID=A0A0N5AM61_9BILA